ncbi:hypothetical protein D3C72_2421420 [compost metagenome]
MGKQHAFLGDAVDAGRFIAHHALVVGTDIEDADVIAKDDQHVRFVGGRTADRYGQQRARDAQVAQPTP